MTVTAMVASLNPAIIARQNTGTDSEEVSDKRQQWSLLYQSDLSKSLGQYEVLK